MAARDKAQLLIHQIIELPAQVQEEVIRSVIGMRAEGLGIYPSDD